MIIGNNLNPPNLDTILYKKNFEIMAKINCMQIGIVQKFYPENQTADIILVAKRKISESLNGEFIYKDYPPLLSVPCIVLRGGLGVLEMPITAGDECLILFNDRDIDNWYLSGKVSANKTDRMHDFNDGIALVGIGSMSKILTDYVANAVKLKYNNTTLVINDTGIISNKVFQSNGYKTADGSTGITTTQTIETGGNVVKTMTIKNGLITGIS